MENEVHLFNFWAIELLDALNVNNPSEQQISCVEDYLLQLVNPKYCCARSFLTKLEKRCLILVSMGETTKKVSIKLKISMQELQIVRKSILQKMKSRNMIQSVVKSSYFSKFEFLKSGHLL